MTFWRHRAVTLEGVCVRVRVYTAGHSCSGTNGGDIPVYFLLHLQTRNIVSKIFIYLFIFMF